MTIGRAAAVLMKEWTDALRDRRSLASGLLYALWGPAVMALALVALAESRDADAPLTVAVVNGDRAQSLLAFLEERSVTILGAPDDPEAAIRARSLPFALVVDADYPDRFADLRPATVRVLYDASWSASNAKAARLRTLLEQYARRMRDVRLVMRGVSPDVAAPLTIVDRDLSTAAGRAAAALATLPIFLLVAVFVGGMNVAADVTAGERERGSLEALLLHPISRLALAAGKWAAAVLICLITVALTVLVAQFVLKHPRIQAINLPIDVSAPEAAGILLVLLPLTMLVPAVQMLVSLFARSFKEAQTQLSLLLFVPMLPGFLFAFGSLQPAAWMSVVPVLGQHVLVTRILRGDPLFFFPIAALTAATLAAAAAAVAATAHLLDNERIIRGQRA